MKIYEQEKKEISFPQISFYRHNKKNVSILDLLEAVTSYLKQRKIKYENRHSNWLTDVHVNEVYYIIYKCITL